MIGRFIWIAALLAVAVVTAAAQLDRQAGMNPERSRLVSGPFRAYAQQHIAIEAAAGHDDAGALGEARLLVLRRPIPVEHLGILAMAQGKAGMAQEAGLTIQVAGQRGWRERLAQESVLRLALEAGDRAEAARRYMALLINRTTPDALLAELGPAVFTQSSGAERETMARILAGGERWQSLFLRRGAEVMPPDAFAEIVLQSIDRGVDCDSAALTSAARRVAQRDGRTLRDLSEAAQGCGGA